MAKGRLAAKRAASTRAVALAKPTVVKPKAAAQSAASSSKTRLSSKQSPTAEEKLRVDMRIREDRRNLEEQAKRAIKLKLLDNGYDKAMVDTLRCKETNETIEGHVIAELEKMCTSPRKKLKAQFWASIHNRFDLGRVIFGELPEISEDHCFPEDLEDAMTPAHSENPAERTAEPFVRYLDWAPKHCREDVVGMLNASVEGAIVRRNNSQKMLLALLKYFGKHSLQHEMADIWKAAVSCLDHVALHHNRESSLERKNTFGLIRWPCRLSSRRRLWMQQWQPLTRKSCLQQRP